jgi:hypothetical protein
MKQFLWEMVIWDALYGINRISFASALIRPEYGIALIPRKISLTLITAI